MAWALVLLAGCSAPTEGPASPYAGFAHAEIRSLTPEQQETLRTGGGGGYALAAELNGWAGPKHALELADQLGLDAAQREATQAIRDRVVAEARAQGEVVLGLYAALDQGFRDGTAEPAWLHELNRLLGEEEGKLRAVHLAAHLELAKVLRPDQQELYAELRGYRQGGHAHTGH